MNGRLFAFGSLEELLNDGSQDPVTLGEPSLKAMTRGGMVRYEASVSFAGSEELLTTRPVDHRGELHPAADGLEGDVSDGKIHLESAPVSHDAATSAGATAWLDGQMNRLRWILGDVNRAVAEHNHCLEQDKERGQQAQSAADKAIRRINEELEGDHGG